MDNEFRRIVTCMSRNCPQHGKRTPVPTAYVGDRFLSWGRVVCAERLREPVDDIPIRSANRLGPSADWVGK